MKSMASFKSPIEAIIDHRHSAETSLVLRYLRACETFMDSESGTVFQGWLRKTSIREGARVFPLLAYRDVDVHVLDETSLMHTRTIKSIDGCVSTAHLMMRGDDRVVFESGGNNGAALAAYCQRLGIEAFCFAPLENLSLLDSKIFEHDQIHLIAVCDRNMVKDAARHFSAISGIRQIPEPGWRQEASMFRGFFILEMLEKLQFDWLAQAISAAFGPIGIYRVLETYGGDLRMKPRFLGVQQQANCPMFTAWKSRHGEFQHDTQPDEELLTKVMYDVRPQTYGTYDDLENILVGSGGDLTTVNASEFRTFLQMRFNGSTVLELLGENGVNIRVDNDGVTEKAGLVALAGLLKEIESGAIVPGSRVLCSLSGGASMADGNTRADHVVSSLNDVETLYSEITNDA